MGEPRVLWRPEFSAAQAGLCPATWLKPALNCTRTPMARAGTPSRPLHHIKCHPSKNAASVPSFMRSSRGELTPCVV